LSHLHC